MLKEENKIKKSNIKKYEKDFYGNCTLPCVCSKWFGQFTCKTIDNGFDEPFKKAFCYSSQNSPDKGALCFEEDIRWPFMYIVGLYFCDDDFIVNIAFDNGNKYNVVGEKSSDSEIVYLSAPDIKQEYDSLGVPIYNPSVGSPNTLLWDDLFDDIKMLHY